MVYNIHHLLNRLLSLVLGQISQILNANIILLLEVTIIFKL